MPALLAISIAALLFIGVPAAAAAVTGTLRVTQEWEDSGSDGSLITYKSDVSYRLLNTPESDGSWAHATVDVLMHYEEWEQSEYCGFIKTHQQSQDYGPISVDTQGTQLTAGTEFSYDPGTGEAHFRLGMPSHWGPHFRWEGECYFNTNSGSWQYGWAGGQTNDTYHFGAAVDIHVPNFTGTASGSWTAAGPTVYSYQLTTQPDGDSDGVPNSEDPDWNPPTTFPLPPPPPGIDPPPVYCSDEVEGAGDGLSLVDTGLQAFEKPVGSKVLGGAGLGFGALGLACAAQRDLSDKSAAGIAAAGACGGLTGASMAFGTAALFTAWNPIGWGAAIGSVATGMAAMVACDQDPPDPKFREMAIVPSVKVRFRPAPPGTPRRAVAVGKDLVRNSARIIATGRALAVSRNRASGAAVAGELSWMNFQRSHVSRLARRLSNLYTRHLQLRRLLTKALKAGGIRNLPISRKRVIRYKRNLPASAVRLLRGAGATSGDIAAIRSRTRRRSVALPSSLYEAMNGRGSQRAVKAAIKAFDLLSKQFAVPVNGS